MTYLKRLVVSFTLVSVLAVAAFADCPAPEPGQTSTPPCSAATQATDESVTPGETQGPPASTTEDVVTVAEVVFWALALI